MEKNIMQEIDIEDEYTMMAMSPSDMAKGMMANEPMDMNQMGMNPMGMNPMAMNPMGMMPMNMCPCMMCSMNPMGMMSKQMNPMECMPKMEECKMGEDYRYDEEGEKGEEIEQEKDELGEERNPEYRPRDVERILQKIERYNPGVFRLMKMYGIPYDVARRICTRIIRLTLMYSDER